MRKLLPAISFLLAIPVFGQSVSPPCGEKGVPDNVPCYDAKSGKVIHTNTPNYAPHQDISPVPPSAPPTVVPTIQPQKVTPPATVAPEVPPPPPTSSAPETKIVVEPDSGEAERQRESYQTGQQIGQAFGNIVFQMRLKHAINKWCFANPTSGWWKLPSGTVIQCADWIRVYPKDAKGRPSVSPETQASIDAICNSRPRGWYTLGTGYNYSCKEWRKKYGRDRNEIPVGVTTQVASDKADPSVASQSLQTQANYSSKRRTQTQSSTNAEIEIASDVKREPKTEAVVPQVSATQTAVRGTGPAPSSGGLAKVFVTSSPVGAEIYADSLFVGRTPFTMRLKPGQHSILLLMKDYKNWSETITAEAGSEVQLTATLEKSN